MSDLIRDNQNISDDKLLFEKLKIEDEIYERFEIEVEHIINLQREIEEEKIIEKQNNSMNADTTADSNQINYSKLERQP